MIYLDEIRHFRYTLTLVLIKYHIDILSLDDIIWLRGTVKRETLLTQYNIIQCIRKYIILYTYEIYIF